MAAVENNVAISIRGASKAYRIWNSPAARFKGPALAHVANCLPASSAPARRLYEKASHYFRDFYALQDVSFDVKRGECLGIIGRNGSGKSTLLQIVAGTLAPTAGEVQLEGRVAALLELGSGFNPEFTGRENVFLNGAVLGMNEDTVKRRFDEIAAFADIGDFIEQPVKTYSSGMLVRLAFSVAIHVEPEILIVDEALAVGDIFFQMKCYDFMKKKLGRMTTLFVSHDMTSVANLCSRAVLLKAGRVSCIGEPRHCIEKYTQEAHSDTFRIESAGKPAAGREGTALNLPEFTPVPTDKLGGAVEVMIRRFRVLANGRPGCELVAPGDEIEIQFDVSAGKPVSAVVFGYLVGDKYGNWLFGYTNVSLTGRVTPSIR
jgi:lipopolysaccharide transport system ATP-binding protein